MPTTEENMQQFVFMSRALLEQDRSLTKEEQSSKANSRLTALKLMLDECHMYEMLCIKNFS